MSRCELTGKSAAVKNLVSHSNIKTKTRSLPNVQKKRIFSPALNQMVRLQIATSTLRDMEHMGGFDVFMLQTDDGVLSKRAMDIKGRLRRKLKSTKN